MLKTFTGRILFVLGLVLFAGLQQRLWLGNGGYYQRQALLGLVQAQQHENDTLAERNRILLAEVDDLKNGLEAVEEHARLDLGLIKPNETFVQMSTLPVPENNDKKTK